MVLPAELHHPRWGDDPHSAAELPPYGAVVPAGLDTHALSCPVLFWWPPWTWAVPACQHLHLVYPLASLPHLRDL